MYMIPNSLKILQPIFESKQSIGSYSIFPEFVEPLYLSNVLIAFEPQPAANPNMNPFLLLSKALVDTTITITRSEIVFRLSFIIF